MSKISEKVLEELQDKPIKELLEMNDRELNTLLLEIFFRRSQSIDPKEVLEKYMNTYEFFGPSKNDLRNILDFNQTFLSCIPDKYDAIELSPITPFGGNTSITSLSQKNIPLSPIRVNNSRRGSIDSFNNFTNNFDIKKPLLANSSNLSINGDYDNCTNNNNICDNSILSNNSKNIFDLEFNTNGSNDLNKSNLNMNMSSLNNSMANIFENPDENNNLTEKDEDQKDLKRLFD